MSLTDKLWKKVAIGAAAVIVFFQFAHHNKIEPGTLALICSFVGGAFITGYEHGRKVGRSEGNAECEPDMRDLRRDLADCEQRLQREIDRNTSSVSSIRGNHDDPGGARQ